MRKVKNALYIKLIYALLAITVLIGLAGGYKIFFYHPAKDRFEAEIMALCTEEDKSICQCVVDKTFEQFTEEQMENLENHTAGLSEAIRLMVVTLTASENCSKEGDPK